MHLLRVLSIVPLAAMLIAGRAEAAIMMDFTGFIHGGGTVIDNGVKTQIDGQPISGSMLVDLSQATITGAGAFGTGYSGTSFVTATFTVAGTTFSFTPSARMLVLNWLPPPPDATTYADLIQISGPLGPPVSGHNGFSFTIQSAVDVLDGPTIDHPFALTAAQLEPPGVESRFFYSAGDFSADGFFLLNTVDVSFVPERVPEPGSLVMLLTALAGLWLMRRMRALWPPRLALSAASAALLAISMSLSAAPASATEMLISFTGTAFDSGHTPISGQLTFDPQAGTIGISPHEPVGRYTGPMGETIEFGGRTFSAAGIGGHVGLIDRFPVNLSDGEPAADIFSTGLLGGTAGDLQINVSGAKDGQGFDFIHGASFTQSFDTSNLVNWEFPNVFMWDLGQPDAINVTFDVSELSMHPVPEPGSLLLLVTAIVGLFGLRSLARSRHHGAYRMA